MNNIKGLNILVKHYTMSSPTHHTLWNIHGNWSSMLSNTNTNASSILKNLQSHSSEDLHNIQATIYDLRNNLILQKIVNPSFLLHQV